MSNSSKKNDGGIHIGRVGANLNIKAGGNLVGGDMIVANGPPIFRGFTSEDEKRKFQATMDEMFEGLREVCAQIVALPVLNAAQKKNFASKIEKEVNFLQDLEAKATALPIDGQLSADVVSAVEKGLARANGIVDTLQRTVKNAVAAAEIIGQFATRFGPLVLRVRHLFGFP